MAVPDREVVKAEQHAESREKGRSRMQRLAGQVEAHHLQPYPGARPPDVNPFPAGVMRGLWIGMLAGALAGLVLGLLLQRNIIAPRGWEGLYSMTPFTFVAFWVLLGLAVGMLIVGVGVILAHPGPAPARRHEDGHQDR